MHVYLKACLCTHSCMCVYMCAYMCAHMNTHRQRHIHMYSVIILSSDVLVQRKRNIFLREICMPSELAKFRAVPEPGP